LSAHPCLLHENVGCDVAHLSDYVEFAQTVEASAPIRDCVKLVAVLMKELTDGMQPMVHETVSFAVHRRAHSATAVVSHGYST